MNIRKIAGLLCALALCLCGCKLLPPKATPNVPKENYADPNKYQSEYQDRLQYQHLSKEEQHGYGLLYTTIRDATDSDAIIQDENGVSHPGVRIPFDVALTKDSMSLLYESFLKDNPQFFFLDRTYSLEGHQQKENVVYDTLLLRFTLNQEERQAAIAELNAVVETIRKNCPSTTDEYVIEKYFHDYLLSHCTYDETAAEGDSLTHENAYSAYGALVQGSAVCEGYAKAMQLLLQQASIPATVVMGTAADAPEAHMWNLVYINGAYYYLDVTWDDNEDIPQYAYFNITSDDLQRSHLPDAEQLVTMECTATIDNYFVRNGTYLDTYERDKIAEIIAQHIQAGSKTIHLRFAPGKYENALLLLKNVQLTKRLVNNQLGNRVTMWDYALNSHTQQHVLTLVATEK